jgi:hypothetical protein
MPPSEEFQPAAVRRVRSPIDKRSRDVRGDDFRGLRHLATRLGDRFHAGYVLYAGEQALPFGDRLTALPMAALWTLNSR